MIYIIGTMLRKAIEKQTAGWSELMLLPEDYETPALHQALTRQLMRRIEFVHGGPTYDALYPAGIPTSIEIDHARLGRLSSGLIKFPAGHARCANDDWHPLVDEKFRRLARLGTINVEAIAARLTSLANRTSEEVRNLYVFA